MNTISITSRNGFLLAFAKDKQTSHLKNALKINSRKHEELKLAVGSYQQKFREANDNKTRIAQDLFNEGRQWKQLLEKAEEKKKIATLTYMGEYLNYNKQIHQIKQNIQDVMNKFHPNPALDEKMIMETTFQPLENQKLRLKKLEEVVMQASKEVQLLQSKPEILSTLSKRLQDAKEHQIATSSQFHQIKSTFVKSGKDLLRMKKLIELSEMTGNFVGVCLESAYLIMKRKYFSK